MILVIVALVKNSKNVMVSFGLIDRAIGSGLLIRC